MAYKILTKNGIDNSNIDGARGEYFNSGMRDGIVQGALNEGLFTATASNIISLDTCELRIAGHRIVIDEPVYHTFTNAPSTDTRYAFVAQIVVDDNQNVDFSLFVQAANTPLIQNDLYKNITGAGTYQVEIGRFTLLTTLTIEDVVRTLDVITGGTGKGSGANINIGNVTTQTLDPDVDAEVDIDTRYVEDEVKEYLDFNFAIPKGKEALICNSVISSQGGSEVYLSFSLLNRIPVVNDAVILIVDDTVSGQYISVGLVTQVASNYAVVNTAGSRIYTKGETGLSTTITDITASVDNNVGTPNVVITEGGEETARTYDFAFHNLKGEQGIQGIQGDRGIPIVSKTPLYYTGTVPPTIENYIVSGQMLNAIPNQNDPMTLWLTDAQDNLYMAIGQCGSVSGSGDFAEISFSGATYKLTGDGSETSQIFYVTEYNVLSNGKYMATNANIYPLDVDIKMGDLVLFNGLILCTADFDVTRGESAGLSATLVKDFTPTNGEGNSNITTQTFTTVQDFYNWYVSNSANCINAWVNINNVGTCYTNYIEINDGAITEDQQNLFFDNDNKNIDLQMAGLTKVGNSIFFTLSLSLERGFPYNLQFCMSNSGGFLSCDERLNLINDSSSGYKKYGIINITSITINSIKVTYYTN